MRYTLGVDTVRAAIQTLITTKSHEQLVLYLAILRLKSRDGEKFTEGDVYSVIKPWLSAPVASSHASGLPRAASDAAPAIS